MEKCQPYITSSFFKQGLYLFNECSIHYACSQIYIIIGHTVDLLHVFAPSCGAFIFYLCQHLFSQLSRYCRQEENCQMTYGTIWPLFFVCPNFPFFFQSQNVPKIQFILIYSPPSPSVYYITKPSIAFMTSPKYLNRQFP